MGKEYNDDTGQPYVTLLTDTSFCKSCERPVVLLSPAHADYLKILPSFFICHDCRAIYIVGLGEVPAGPDLISDAAFLDATGSEAES